MNEELSPAERADVRARLLLGAKRIHPVGKHRNAMIAASLSVVLVAAVAAGAVGVSQLLGTAQPAPIATVTPEPTPTPSPTPTRSATSAPTPTPTATSTVNVRGTTAFGGDCANALSTQDAAAALGPDTFLYEPAWRSGQEGLQGGLVCTWADPTSTSRSSISLVTYPAGSVPAELLDKQLDCADMGACVVTGVRNGTWLQVTLRPSPGVDPTTRVWELAASRLSQFDPPQPATRTPGWWPRLTCGDILQRVDLAGATGLTDIQETVVSPTPTPTLSYGSLPALLGDVTYCSFTGSAGGNWRTVGVRVIPGAAPYFAAIAQSTGATPVTVRGAIDAVSVQDDSLWEGHYPQVVVTDGVNLLTVGADYLLDPDTRLLVAEAFLAAMK